MLPLTEKSVLASVVNASRKETSDISLPLDFDETRWDRLDYYGWRDRRIARRAYIAVPVGDELVGVMLTQADASPRARAQCSWCQDIQLPNDVVFFSARRSGAAGRNGDTVGILICADFECSSNVRKAPPMAYLGFDVEAARLGRIAALQERSAGFAVSVRDGS